MDLIVADFDRHYASALAGRLKTWRPDLTISCCQDQTSLNSLIADYRARNSPLLLLYNEAEFIALKHLQGSQVWPASWLACPIAPHNTAEQDDPASPWLAHRRFDPVSQLISQLEQKGILSEHGQNKPGQADASQLARTGSLHDCTYGGTKDQVCSDFFSAGRQIQASLQVSDSQTAKLTYDLQPDRYGAEENPLDTSLLATARIWLLLDLTAGYPGNLPGQKRLRQMLKTGRPIIYLPLMPTYSMRCLVRPGQGPSLSDLMLQLHIQPDQPVDIGHYWQPHPDGFFHFRPPARSDDILSCSADVLRRLVTCLKNRMAAQPDDPLLAMIECSCLPLTSVAAVAVLCDTCEVWLPAHDDYASDSARYEAGRFLASLPASCRVVRQIVGRQVR